MPLLIMGKHVDYYTYTDTQLYSSYTPNELIANTSHTI